MSERRTLKLPARPNPPARTRSGPLRPVAPKQKRDEIREARRAPAPAAPAPPTAAVPGGAEKPPARARKQPTQSTAKRPPRNAGASTTATDAGRTTRRREDADGTTPRKAPAPARPKAAAPKPRAGTHKPGPRDAAAPRKPAPRATAGTVVEKARDNDWPRLSKLMSERGMCSRREADEWIANGWVQVNGKRVDQLGTRVPPEAHIEVNSSALKHQTECVTILLHKPIGFVSGQAEDGYAPAITLVKPDARWSEDTLPRQFKAGHLRGLAPAGRLDIDSTGLLVLTQDGRIARRLIGEHSEVEKEYLVRVEGELSDDGLKRLNHGLALDGVKLKPARVSWQNEHQLRFVLREGKKRQIRRMCELVGLRVTGLKRIRIGSVSLGKLPAGQWRYLRPDERF